MGGLAGAAGDGRLTPSPAPVWLEGGGAVLPRWSGAPLVWLLDLDLPADRDRIETSAPSPDETRAFAGRLDAAYRVLRRRAARLLLAATSGSPAGGVAIMSDRLGAPLVQAPAGWWLSAAARWPRCVVAVDRRPIGVDLEVATTPLPADLLTAPEQALVAALPPGERPLAGAAAWAAKEAHAKWSGRPREVNPAAVETSEAGSVRSSWGTTLVWRKMLGNAVVAVCQATDQSTVEAVRLEG